MLRVWDLLGLGLVPCDFVEVCYDGRTPRNSKCIAWGPGGKLFLVLAARGDLP